MRPELSEKLFVEKLFSESSKKLGMDGVTILDVDKMTGDASTRRYYRIELSNKESYVVCLDDPVNDAESNFVILQEVLSENKVRVPKIYDKNLDNGYLLEEDLGNETFIKKLAGSNIHEERELYQRVLEELIKIHDVNVEKYKQHKFSTLSFDLEKLNEEMLFTMNHFLGGFLGVDVEDKTFKPVFVALRDICKELDVKEKVLTHRDFHSRNIMLKDGELIFIDFQDSRMGIPQYDLVSLLEDCYYELESENKSFLKSFYLENFLAKKKIQSNDEFNYYYDLMTIQRVLKAIGSFSYIFKLRGDKRYVKYIGFGFEKVRQVLSRHKKFHELKSILSEVYYAN